jgi:hypothetical protein
VPWDFSCHAASSPNASDRASQVAPGNEVPSDYFDALQAQSEEKLTKIKVFTAVRVELPSDAVDVVGTDSDSSKNGVLRRGPQPREQRTRPLGRMIVQRVPLAPSVHHVGKMPQLPLSVLCLHHGSPRNRDAKAPLHNTRLHLPDVKAPPRGSKERG